MTETHPGHASRKLAMIQDVVDSGSRGRIEEDEKMMVFGCRRVFNDMAEEVEGGVERSDKCLLPDATDCPRVSLGWEIREELRPRRYLRTGGLIRVNGGLNSYSE